MNFVEIEVFGEELAQSNLGIDNSFIMNLSFIPNQIEHFFESEIVIDEEIILTTEVRMKSGNKFMANVPYNDFKSILNKGGWNA